jgi:hypothetical protein
MVEDVIRQIEEMQSRLSKRPTSWKTLENAKQLILKQAQMLYQPDDLLWPQNQPNLMVESAGVYLVGAVEAKAVKIGYSARPLVRLSQIQTGSPFVVELLSVIDGDVGTEAVAHSKFRKYRMRGEWFKWSPEIIEWFDEKASSRIQPTLHAFRSR